MYRSTEAIHRDMDRIGFDPSSEKWKDLSKELMQVTHFWSEVRGLTRLRLRGPLPLPREMDVLRNYMGLHSLQFADAVLIRQMFESLLASGDIDADEGIAMLKHFLQLEEGQHVAREVDLAVNRYYTGYFVDESGPALCEDWDDDDPDAYMGEAIVDIPGGGENWFRHTILRMKDALDDDDKFREYLNNTIPDHSLKNLQACLRPLLSEPINYGTDGIYQSIREMFRFVERRNYRELSMRQHKPSTAREGGC